MKKKFVRSLFIFAFTGLLLVGCISTTKSANITLELDDQKVSFEFIQNEVSVPVSSQNDRLEVVLKPEPFTLKIDGDKSIVSIMALQSDDLALALLQSSKPWVAPLGTGYASTTNDLYLSYRSLEFYTANSDTLQNLPVYSFAAEEATGMANTLKDQLGTEPLALISARTYLVEEDQNYLIKTINKNAIQSGNSVFLLVFIEKQSNDPFFRVLKWLAFNVEFQ
ncbi:MAG TPA: hypothetical protein VHP14_26990 [Anaerolineales bacterium]|nr:hypothetical protein [Anaerolineales bacterium]